MVETPLPIECLMGVRKLRPNGNYAQTEITPKRKLRPNVNYAQGNYDNVITYTMSLNAGAKRRAIWPCLNVATWGKERSDRAIQQTC